MPVQPNPHISKHTFGYHIFAPGTNFITTGDNYSVTKTDSVILVTAAPVTIDLTTNEADFPIGKILIVKDATGNASNNNINFTGTIDNTNFTKIDWDWGSVILYFKDTTDGWYILAKF